jgi:hypothetical protein
VRKEWDNVIFWRDLFATTAIIVVLVLAVPAAADQEEKASEESVSEKHGAKEHTYHKNHFGGFLGASTHLDDEEETAFTLGLDYARQFHPRWAVLLFTELSSSRIERDTIVGAGAIFYPMARLALIAGPGVELVSEDVEHHGEIENEKESEFLVRLGATYGFPVGEAKLGPTVFADWAGDRWTIVYGIVMVTGF